ncbi:MAG: hypothetical protein AUJ92_07670 [Armatimonadetes bacterium CG2_30_59_28]|nr:helix-turn-helix transcriptional regulator [Armatimonadota bacterium]OIO95561.1 MAG: hypothetical protein AUJ92_07670 [Armatimonadetes bacterium CG2_30_59_28]PIU62748.1 MAG: transcriptional regulator [Armatimonadetes bacterium CG07_land_8_20_14_0_80_59_28]PIY37230.1 MAG: transcriptional regulator [Armatimonadetes bacterium CG_4_10_14_3_um_filter_59_10]
MDDDLKQHAKRFRALSDETRLRILQILWSHGETCVCELMEALKMTQSNISFHLNTLRNAGLVSDRKMGKWVFYTANDEAVAALGAVLGGIFDPERRFSERLQDSIYSLCCDGQNPLSREAVASLCCSRKRAAVEREAISKRKKVG